MLWCSFFSLSTSPLVFQYGSCLQGPSVSSAGVVVSPPLQPTANYHIYREASHGIRGICDPQLRLQRNDHCKSHSVSLSCKFSHGCHGDHDVIVKAILSSVGFDHSFDLKSYQLRKREEVIEKKSSAATDLTVRTKKKDKRHS